MPSPWVRRLHNTGTHALVPASATLGDHVPEDNRLPTADLPAWVCRKALTTRDCRGNHAWHFLAGRWVPQRTRICLRWYEEAR